VTTLSGRLVVLASALVVLAASTVAFVLTRSTERDLRTATSERGFAVARGIADLAAGPLERGDRAALDRLLDVVWADPDVGRVEIVDAYGRMAASRSQLPGRADEADVVAWNIDGPRDEEGYRLRIGLVRVEMSRRGVEAQVRSGLMRAVLVAGIVASLGVLAAALVGGVVARPLRRLETTSVAVAEGAYEAALGELPEGGTAEVRALAAALREAVTGVANRETDLRAANDALRRAEAARDELSHALVHDLKGPIANVISVLDVLDDAVPDPEDRALVEDLRARCRRLLDTVGDLLDANRLEHGRLAIDARECDLGEVAYRALSSVDFLARAEGVSIEAEIPEEELPVVCDAKLVERVLTNLLVNAIRHGAPPVRLAARTVEAGAELVVEDGGDGVPPGQEEAVFDRFATSGAGTGLGLSFVRQAVEAHGGEVGVAGSRFCVRLPA